LGKPASVRERLGLLDAVFPGSDVLVIQHGAADEGVHGLAAAVEINIDVVLLVNGHGHGLADLLVVEWLDIGIEFNEIDLIAGALKKLEVGIGFDSGGIIA
jgi:hypothetical protein